MSRVIKFRAWNVCLKEMEDMKYLQESGGIAYIGNDEYSPYIFLQYTGLKDKNGVEIYEGDVIHAFKNNGLYEVQFGSHESADDDGVYDIYYQGFYLLRYFDGKPNPFKEPLGRKSNENLEVIGNIYENPELLEVEHES